MGTSEEGVKLCACGKRADIEATMKLTALTEQGERLLASVDPVTSSGFCFWCALRAALGLLAAPYPGAGRVSTPGEGDPP